MCELAHHLGLLGALDVLVRRVVVGNQRDLLGIPDLVDADLAELLDRDRRRDVVGEHEVEIALDELAGNDLIQPGVSREYLLGDSHGSGHGSRFTPYVSCREHAAATAACPRATSLRYPTASGSRAAG